MNNVAEQHVIPGRAHSDNGVEHKNSDPKRSSFPAVGYLTDDTEVSHNAVELDNEDHIESGTLLPISSGL